MTDFSWHTLHLLRPAWLLLLPAWWGVLWWIYHKEDNTAAWQRVCDPVLLDYLLMGTAVQRVVRWWWCLALVGSLLLLAMAGPVWKQLAEPVYRQSSALVVLLDVSRSMDSQDLQPSRLQHAKQKLHDLLALRQEGQTALIVFAGEAFVVTPLTDDIATIDAQLQSIRTDMMPVQGSHPAKAVSKAITLLKQSGIAHGDVFLIGDELPAVNDSLMSAAIQALTDAGHVFSAMPIGSMQGAPIPLQGGSFIKDAAGHIVIPHVDSTLFSYWVDQGKGQYHAMTLDNQDIESLQGAWQQIMNNHHYQQADTTIFNRDQWREDAPWLLLVLLPLVALVFRRGWLVILVIICIPHPAQAFDWTTLWLNADQQGARLLQQDQYSEAAKAFDDPQWKAAAAYQAGDYGQAAKLLAPLSTADAHYNRGNALARAGNIEAAIVAYQACLTLQSDHADALYNKKLLEEQKKKEKKQSQKKQQGKNKDNKQGKQGKQGEQGNKGQQEGQGKQQPAEKSAVTKEEQQKKDQQAIAKQGKKDDGKKKTEQQAVSHDKKPPQSPMPAEQHKINDADALKKMEARQAYEQFIRRVPDDPGGLLRRKFLYQYQQQQHAPTKEDKTW